VEIGTEAAQFPEKEYINAIFLAVYSIIGLDENVYFQSYKNVNFGNFNEIVYFFR
jgi:hypothetical protein